MISGGDIIKFAGDAIIVLFHPIRNASTAPLSAVPADSETRQDSSAVLSELHDAAMRCLLCSWALKTAIRKAQGRDYKVISHVMCTIHVAHFTLFDLPGEIVICSQRCPPAYRNTCLAATLSVLITSQRVIVTGELISAMCNVKCIITCLNKRRLFAHIKEVLTFCAHAVATTGADPW